MFMRQDNDDFPHQYSLLPAMRCLTAKNESAVGLDMLSLPVPCITHIASFADPFTVCRLARSCRYLNDVVELSIKRLPRPSFNIRITVDVRKREVEIVARIIECENIFISSITNTFRKTDLENILSQLKYGRLCATTVEVFGDNATDVERVINNAKMTNTDEYYLRWLCRGKCKLCCHMYGRDFQEVINLVQAFGLATPRVTGNLAQFNDELMEKQYNLLSHAFNGKNLDSVTIRGVPNTLQNVLTMFLKFFMSSDEKLQKRRSARISFSTKATVDTMDRELHEFINRLGLYNMIEEDLSILYYTRKITFVSHAKYRLCILVVCPLQGYFLVSLSCNGVADS